MHRMMHVTAILIALAGPALLAQGKQADVQEQLQKADAAMRRAQFEDAMQAYKKAWSLSGKTSTDACLGLALAYRGLGAHKNVLDVCGDALKLADTDQAVLAQVHNLRGTALVALAEKPGDSKLREAETDFRAALAANPNLHSARLNLGITLLKMNRDEEGVRELQAYVERAPNARDTVEAKKMIAEPRRAREIFAPDFSFTSRQGEYISLEDLKGKTVVLDFWGSWCGPCVAATPGLVKLHRKFAEQGVVFIGIARDEEDAWGRFIEKNKLDWPQFLDSSNRIIRAFAVQAYPTYVVLDRDGVVRARRSGHGPDTEGWLEHEIKDSLKKQ